MEKHEPPTRNAKMSTAFIMRNEVLRIELSTGECRSSTLGSAPRGQLLKVCAQAQRSPSREPLLSPPFSLPDAPPQPKETPTWPPSPKSFPTSIATSTRQRSWITRRLQRPSGRKPRRGHTQRRGSGERYSSQSSLK